MKIKETWNNGDVKTRHFLLSCSQDQLFLYQSSVPLYYPAVIWKLVSPVSLS